MRIFGFTLFELLLIILFMSLLLFSSITTINILLAKIQAKYLLQELDYALQLAKTYALSNNLPCNVCPKDNVWDLGIELSQNSKIVFQRKHSVINGHITLNIFKNQDICITILPNGMTHNNGNFSYTARGLHYNIYYKLVFNKGLRTYQLTND